MQAVGVHPPVGLNVGMRYKFERVYDLAGVSPPHAV